MSAASVKRGPYDAAAEAEVARWPGVTMRREVRGKHYALLLTFNGVTRFVIYPTSPGDAVRGQQNHLADVRQALRDLGAERVAARKGARRHRQRRAMPEAPVKLVRTEAPAGRGPERDPFAALAGLKLQDATPPPAQPPSTFWCRLLALFRRPA